MKPPLVSVITATWQRHDLLMRCIESVRQQTYPNVEHIVVSDGLDLWLAEHLDIDLRYMMLKNNYADWGATPRLVVSDMVHGELVAYLDDDNVYLPQHLERLQRAMEETGADCAFSQMQLPNGGVVGDGEVELAHMDTSMVMHKRELFEIANWRPAGYCADWDLFERWRDAGIGWIFVPEVTVRYRPEDT